MGLSHKLVPALAAPMNKAAIARIARAADRYGMKLVPKEPAVANWLPVFIRMIREDKPVFAVKLWAEITRYEEPSGHLNIREANRYVSAIRSHNENFPQGGEHPDLDPAKLAYYAEK